MRLPRQSRGAFTLLEVILASSISVLLLAALYIALDLQVRMAQTGRETVEEATIVRAIFARVTRDLLPSLTPVAAVKGAAGGTTGTTGTAADASTDTSAEVIPIASGVIGDGSSLAIFTSRVTGPNDIVASNGLEENTSQPSDQRRINYWLSSSSTVGLCRQEEKWLTADSIANSTTPDVQNEGNHLIAPEVTELQFEYFDGTSWNDSWDGSTLAADGKTPMGPPLAIRVHLWIKSPNRQDAKEYRKVIAILTGPSAPTTSTSTDATTGTTTP